MTEKFSRKQTSLKKLLKVGKKDIAVFSFGRMNPPTIGHELLVERIKYASEVYDADPMLFISHSEDHNKNPLPYDRKFELARKAFGKMVISSEAKTIVEVLQHVNYYYENAIMLVGEDRLDAFTELVEKYNGKEYEFKRIEVVSVGHRCADSDDIEGVSATKMRELARHGAFKKFRAGLPKKIRKDAFEIMNDVRAGLKLLPEKKTWRHLL